MLTNASGGQALLSRPTRVAFIQFCPGEGNPYRQEVVVGDVLGMFPGTSRSKWLQVVACGSTRNGLRDAVFTVLLEPLFLEGLDELRGLERRIFPSPLTFKYNLDIVFGY